LSGTQKDDDGSFELQLSPKGGGTEGRLWLKDKG
jgi:hypothetical protein